MKRFYTNTAVDAGDGGWRVLLDGKPMRTPAQAVLTAPTRAQAVAALRAAVAAHGDLALSALYNLTHTSGSVVIGLAVAEQYISAAEAFAAAQLDELYQVERWGADPIATERHDGIRHDMNAGAT